jgi:hypothetical protein
VAGRLTRKTNHSRGPSQVGVWGGKTILSRILGLFADLVTL